MSIETKHKKIEQDKIGEYKPHKSADSYPMLTLSRHKKLVADIRANGQLQPVIVFEKYIYDGRNRLKALFELGRDVLAIVANSEEDALELAQSNNEKRRHMSKSQFAMKAAFRILASRVNEDGTDKADKDCLVVKKVEEIIDKIVSKRSVDNAIAIVKADKDLAEKVFNGDMEISDALRTIAKNKAEMKGKQQVEDTDKPFNDNQLASEKYNAYIAKGKFKLTELAKRLVEAELELEKFRNNN